MTKPSGDYQPSRRELLRPAEYVGGAAIAAIFVGVVALVATRDIVLAGIGAGIVFIVVLMVLALIAMTFKPDAAESAELAGTTDAPGTADAASERPVISETPDAPRPDAPGPDAPGPDAAGPEAPKGH